MSGFVSCPTCGVTVEVVELNCKIFRCGIFKATGQQLNPHAPKQECDRAKQMDLIHGCGSPFIVRQDDQGQLHADNCGYI